MKVRFYKVDGVNGKIIKSTTAEQEEFKHIPKHPVFSGMYKANTIVSISGYSTVKPVLFFLETSPIFNYCLIDTFEIISLLTTTNRNALFTFTEVFSDKIYD